MKTTSAFAGEVVVRMTSDEASKLVDAINAALETILVDGPGHYGFVGKEVLEELASQLEAV